MLVIVSSIFAGRVILLGRSVWNRPISRWRYPSFESEFAGMRSLPVFLNMDVADLSVTVQRESPLGQQLDNSDRLGKHGR